MNAYKLLLRMAIALDIACLAVALTILYCANRNLLPMWGLLAGALFALALICGSIYCLMAARRILKKHYERLPEDDDNEQQTDQ